MRPGIVDVAVLPPVRVDDWTPRDLDRRIAAVRQAFVDTLERWPAPRARQAPRRRRK
jgi:putative phosphoserine phosphatase/1-acylglycerol-3-phosphate O-acyltransferase